jgi:hypothetical protein
MAMLAPITPKTPAAPVAPVQPRMDNPRPTAVEVKVDNAYLENLIKTQQAQIDALGMRMDDTITQLTAAVRKLEPGSGFSVTVTEWTPQGRIKTLKISKE